MKKRIHHTKPKQKKTIFFFALRNAVEIGKKTERRWRARRLLSTQIFLHFFSFRSRDWQRVYSYTHCFSQIVRFFFFRESILLFGGMRDSPVPSTHIFYSIYTFVCCKIENAHRVPLCKCSWNITQYRHHF